MKKLEQIRTLVGLQEHLANAGYQFKWFRNDYESQHHEFLISDFKNHGIIYGNLVIDEESNKLIRVFHSTLLEPCCTHQFIDAIKFMESYSEDF